MVKILTRVTTLEPVDRILQEAESMKSVHLQPLMALEHVFSGMFQVAVDLEQRHVDKE
jgi:hypothetical protein